MRMESLAESEGKESRVKKMNREDNAGLTGTRAERLGRRWPGGTMDKSPSGATLLVLLTLSLSPSLSLFLS